ncbi:MAG: hypothetical protein JNK04_20775, partial [Myxococcales bacterium]|nr:hypothetical protein [Myxococcales bacterium]
LIVATHTDEERKALAEILEGIDELEVVDTQAARSNLVEYWEDLDERALTIAKKRA